MAKFNHAFDIAFSLVSEKQDASDVTAAMLKEALLKRIENLDAEDTWIEAAGAPFDTYEEEA